MLASSVAAECGGEEPGRDGAGGERGAGEPEPPGPEARRHPEPEDAEAAAEAEEEQPRPARAPGPADGEADHDGGPDRHRAEQHVHGHLRHRGAGAQQQRNRLLAPPPPRCHCCEGCWKLPPPLDPFSFVDETGQTSWEEVRIPACAACDVSKAAEEDRWRADPRVGGHRVSSRVFLLLIR